MKSSQSVARPLLAAAVASLLYLGYAGPSVLADPVPLRTENMVNEDIFNNTGEAQNSFQIHLKGNQIARLQDAYYVNPFDGWNTVTKTYDAAADSTTITFTGPMAVPDQTEAHVGYQLANSFARGTEGYPVTLSKNWGGGGGGETWWNVGATLGVDTIVDLWDPPAQEQFITLYVELNMPDGTTEREWNEVPIPYGVSLNAFIEMPLDPLGNYVQQAVTVSNVRYKITDEQIPLGNLNMTDEGPVGFFGVWAVPNFTPLAPGDTISFNIAGMPETHFVFVPLLGLTAFAYFRHRLRQKRA